MAKNNGPRLSKPKPIEPTIMEQPIPEQLTLKDQRRAIRAGVRALKHEWENLAAKHDLRRGAWVAELFYDLECAIEHSE